MAVGTRQLSMDYVGNFQFVTIHLKTQNTPHHASGKRTVRGVRSIMRLLSDTRSRRLNLPGQCHILRCRWHWKAVCPAPDINRKRTCTPTCKAACRSVPPPWRTAAQSLLHPARRGRAIFIMITMTPCGSVKSCGEKSSATQTWERRRWSLLSSAVLSRRRQKPTSLLHPVRMMIRK